MRKYNFSLPQAKEIKNIKKAKIIKVFLNQKTVKYVLKNILL